MGFDLTMIAPGPAGTTMIGESNIDTVARRGRERIRREQEAQLMEKGDRKDDAQSEKTLTAQQSTSTPTSTATEADAKSENETTLAPSIQTKVGQSRKSGLRGRWERIQEKWRGKGGERK